MWKGSPVVKVGVVLAATPADVGGWLADGAAFEAAGACALWVDWGPDAVLDPLTLTGALAVVTSRSLLVTTLPGLTTLPAPEPAFVRTLVTVGRLSRGRLRVFTDAMIPGLEDVAVDGGFGVLRRIPGDAGVFEDVHDPSDPHQWLAVESPESRSTWHATVLDATERGHSRLMVPANPRLLDILRNAEEPDDRRDLHLAMG
jgi:hypothetical protein